MTAYFSHRAAQGLSPASLSLARSAIRRAHYVAGHRSPTDSPRVREALKGIRRHAGRNRQPRQAAALTAAALKKIRATACLPRLGRSGRAESPRRARKRGLTDVALASVMRDALLRRSEAAALQWRDVAFYSDGSGRVTVRRSKTDQDGHGAVSYLGREAAAALLAIRPPAPDPAGRVFKLRSSRQISRRIAAMATAAGLGDGFSGHSPRVGMARDLAAEGAGLTEIMVAGRWRSPKMPAYYARNQRAGRSAVAKYHRRNAV